jgi:hypothetical protein
MGYWHCHFAKRISKEVCATRCCSRLLSSVAFESIAAHTNARRRAPTDVRLPPNAGSNQTAHDDEPTRRREPFPPFPMPFPPIGGTRIPMRRHRDQRFSTPFLPVPPSSDREGESREGRGQRDIGPIGRPGVRRGTGGTLVERAHSQWRACGFRVPPSRQRSAQWARYAAIQPPSGSGQ